MFFLVHPVKIGLNKDFKFLEIEKKIRKSFADRPTDPIFFGMLS